MAFLALLVPATSVAIDLPSDTPTPAAAPAAAPAAQAPAAALVAPRTVRLRIGSRGPTVRTLQRVLRKRGHRFVRVDGAFGPATRRAVRREQRRLRMRVTGVADARFLRRLGIQASSVAASPATFAGPVLGARWLRTFPVLGEYQYIDSFGAARHQGSHEGTDVMADTGTPLVAVADGTIIRMTRTERGLGGIYIWLRDTAGNEYYYAHMASIAEGLEEGSRVAVGQVVGTVGNTGDARHTAPHLHFEIHPGGGGAVNPYSDLRAVDPKVREG